MISTIATRRGRQALFESVRLSCPRKIRFEQKIALKQKSDGLELTAPWGQ
jgi:hypothetical protein